MNEDIREIFNKDLRPVDTEHAVAVLRKFIEIMEAQLEEVHHLERVALEAGKPETEGEVDWLLFCDERRALEELWEDELARAMRYSFVVLMHTVFESRLRSFCSDMQKHRGIRIGLSDLRGSEVDKCRIYLTKLAQLAVADIPEWESLRSFQNVRDCIVHAYGYVDEAKAADIRRLEARNIGIRIDACGRLAVAKAFCDEHLGCLDRFFRRLFEAVGWR